MDITNDNHNELADISNKYKEIQDKLCKKVDQLYKKFGPGYPGIAIEIFGEIVQFMDILVHLLPISAFITLIFTGIP